MEDTTIIWAIICLILALVLFFLEVFVPSGGLIGLLSGGTLVAGIVLLFRVDSTLGVVGILVTLLAVPFLLALALKLWPNTPIGRMLILQHAKTPIGSSESPASLPPASLVGVEGKAISDMRPVGTCVINGRREECLAEGGFIRAGSTVKVTSASGMQIKVRAV